MTESLQELQALLEFERAARIEAERASRLKDEFIEALGHELRPPLNAILGWSRLMELGRLDASETQSAGQTISRNARHLAHLVDDLLDLSAVTSGKIRVDPEETDLCEIVEAALDILQPMAKAKGVQLRKGFFKPDCLVFGDPHRLQQVFWHLINNAIKFTPRGGLALISLRSGGQDCEISVTDTGTGIASDVLPFVFDRFWRGDTSPEQRFSGLGLGLALAKRLVELHGGTVTATSAGPNQGSTFTVVLPRVAPRVSADEQQHGNKSAAGIDLQQYDAQVNVNELQSD
jgi:signal transduction histidine kinase